MVSSLFWEVTCNDLFFFKGTVFLSNKSLQSFVFSKVLSRGGSTAAVTFKMECFVIIVNGRKPFTIITKYSILDVAAAEFR